MINEIIVKSKEIFLLTDTRWHVFTIQLIVGILMITLYLWITAGILSSLLYLAKILKNDWSHIAERIIIDPDHARTHPYIAILSGFRTSKGDINTGCSFGGLDRGIDRSVV